MDFGFLSGLWILEWFSENKFLEIRQTGPNNHQGFVLVVAKQIIKPMIKPIKKPRPNPRNPIVSREYIEIIKFFMNRFAKSDHWAREPGKKGQGGNGVSGIKRYLHTFFTKNYQKPPKSHQEPPLYLTDIFSPPRFILTRYYSNTPIYCSSP